MRKHLESYLILLGVKIILYFILFYFILFYFILFYLISLDIILFCLLFPGTLIVNPGQLAKGASGGSYAEMSIHPISETELQDAKIAGKETINHTVASRSYVNILKI